MAGIGVAQTRVAVYQAVIGDQSTGRQLESGAWGGIIGRCSDGGRESSTARWSIHSEAHNRYSNMLLLSLSVLSPFLKLIAIFVMLGIPSE